MLEIEINGERLEMPPDGVSITLKWSNGILFTQKDTFPHSLPINVPGTDRNHAIFGYAAFVEVENDVRSYDCIARFNGVELPFTKFVVHGYNKTYRGHLSAKQFDQEFLNKSLNEFDYGNTQSLGATSAAVANYCQNNYPSKGYGFPTVYNSKFYSDKNDDWENKINPKGTDLTNANGNKYAFVPMPYFHFILKKCFASIGWGVSGTFFNDPIFAQALLYNNFALDAEASQQSYTAQVSTYSNNWGPFAGGFNYIRYSGGSQAENFDLNNNLYEIKAAGTYSFRVAGGAAAYTHGRYVIRITIYIYKQGDSNYLEASAPISIAEGGSSYTFEVERDFSAAEVSTKLYTTYKVERADPEVLDWGAVPTANVSAVFKAERQIEDFGENVYQKSFEYNEIIPDFKLVDIIKGLRSTACLHTVYDTENKEFRANYVNDILSTTEFDDWTDKVKGEPRPKFGERNGYLFKWGLEEFAGDYIQEGPGGYVVQPFLNPVAKRHIFGTRNTRTQTIEEPGQSATYDQENKPTPRILWDSDKEPIKLRWSDQTQNGLGDTLIKSKYERSLPLNFGKDPLEWDLDLEQVDLGNWYFERKKRIDNRIYLLLDVKTVLKGDTIKSAVGEFIQLSDERYS